MKAVRMTAKWCSPCSGLKKTLESKGITIEAVDIDENREMAMKYGVRGIPTILFLDDDGLEVDTRIVGAELTDAQYTKLKELSI